MSVQRIEVTENDEKEIHFAEGGYDMAICGCDIMGDDNGGKVTNKNVTCEHCTDLVKLCKKIRLRDSEK